MHSAGLNWRHWVAMIAPVSASSSENEKVISGSNCRTIGPQDTSRCGPRESSTSSYQVVKDYLVLCVWTSIILIANSLEHLLLGINVWNKSFTCILSFNFQIHTMTIILNYRWEAAIERRRALPRADSEGQGWDANLNFSNPGSSLSLWNVASCHCVSTHKEHSLF